MAAAKPLALFALLCLSWVLALLHVGPFASPVGGTSQAAQPLLQPSQGPAYFVPGQNNRPSVQLSPGSELFVPGRNPAPAGSPGEQLRARRQLDGRAIDDMMKNGQIVPTIIVL